jgi:hypothetical protein
MDTRGHLYGHPSVEVSQAQNAVFMNVQVRASIQTGGEGDNIATTR